jgi:hypothetical protein
MKNLINDFIEKIANDCVDVYNDCERTQYYPKEKMIKNRIEFVGIVLNNNFENGISLKIEDVCSVLSKKFEHYVNDDNLDINISDLKINVLPQDKTQKIASEIFEKLEENRRQFLLKRNVEFNDYEFDESDEEKVKEEQKQIVTKILNESFEKSKTIEINKEKMEKSKDFETGIFILNRNLEEYIFNEDENPKNEVEINFSKINGKESYEINIYDYKNKENKVQIKSDNLTNFKEKIVDLLEKNIEKYEDFYEEKFRQGFLNTLKRLNTEILKIENKDDIEFSFKNKVYKVNSFEIKIENEKSIIEKQELQSPKEIGYILKNDDYSELIDRNFLPDKNRKNLKKIEYTEKETEYYIEKIDKAINEEDLKLTKLSINFDTARNLYKERGKMNFNDFKQVANNTFEKSFNDRISVIKDKEKLVKDNLEEFGITIEDIPSNENEKKDFIEELINIYKENASNKFVEKLENFKEIEESHEYVYGEESALEREEFILMEALNMLYDTVQIERSDYFDLQDYTINNLIAITLSEDKLGLSDKDLSNLKDIDDKAKDKLYEKVTSKFNKLSDSSNGNIDKKTFDRVCEEFVPHYDKLSNNTELTSSLQKQKQKELDIEKEFFI